jgi:hypothetical protein
MPQARPQQMSDPAEKSDDLIAELAKLMAASPGGDKPGFAPMARPAPLEPVASAPAPSQAPPIRIPGMDQPRPAAAAPPPRAPVTGAIRIPGMDNPAPVATSAPVSKFDFGAKPAAAAPIKQEPLSTLTERLAAQNPATRIEPNVGPTPSPQAQATPVRIPSDLKPVSENRSFAQGPALTVAAPGPQPAPAPQPAPTPAAQESNSGDFGFDFGFTRNPPASASPPRPTDEPEGHDPIADLIASSMGDLDSGPDRDDPAPAPRMERPAPTPVPATPAPVVRASVASQQPVQKSALTPMGGAPRPANSQPIPLKPVSVAPRAPETDRFATSPGANIKPQPPQPLNTPVQRAPEPTKPAFDDTDPMSEIENLIGDAVRVELSPPGPVRVQAVQQKVAPHVAIESDLDIDGDGVADTASAPRSNRAGPAPVVPPLSTQFAPRRSGLKDDGGQASAEDAILAAAAATGAQVDHIDAAVRDESPYRRLKVKPARSSFASGGIRQYVGMAVAGTLLLAAGLGLYWVLNMGRANTLATGDNAPQLTADATPVKEVPSTPVPAETEAARSPVLEQMAGTSVEPSAEQLVSTDETADTAVARDVTNVAAADDTEGGLANRKVRTVTVRPDGTIVSGDDAVAGTEALPVDRPNVPAMPAASDTTNLLGDTTSVAMTDPVTENTALTSSPAPLTAAVETPTAPVQTAEAAIEAIPNAGGVAPTPINFPVRSPTVTAFVDNTPAPAPSGELTGARTPTGQIDLLGGEIEVAAAEPAAPLNTSTAAAYVQLSSSPSQADAQASVRALNNRFGSLFGGNQLVVQSADLGQKGTWYRVKLPAASLGDASQVCAQIKANGGDCIVTGG